MTAGSVSDLPAALQLADWRRRVASLYAAVRQAPAPEVAWDQWRGGRNALFREHPQSPLPDLERSRFRGLPLYAYDAGWRFVVDTHAVDHEPGSTAELGSDGALHLIPCARTIGLAPILGRDLTLFSLSGYGGGLFLPFRDGTAGTETYGGGRYLLDTVKGADLGLEDGRLILDFNFSYHPSCSYAPRWTCPLAPAENQLDIPVTAGERLR